MKHLLYQPVRQHDEPLPPIQAYSEFMPPPRLGYKPYGTGDSGVLPEDDPHGWNVSEFEEAQELQPGLAHLASEFIVAMEHLGNGRPSHGIAAAERMGNPFWPPELADAAGRLSHERYVVLAPLALSRTQDDKGRVRWTLFGGSEQGPARAFWKGFFRAPGREARAEDALDFFRRLLSTAYGKTTAELTDLHKSGFRILPGLDCPLLPAHWQQEQLPSWTDPYLLADSSAVDDVRFLLTFRPFLHLPPMVRHAYLAGRLHLLPFPGSLVFWGAPPFLALRRELPLAMQIPLLHLFPRRERPGGIRVPQSGWMHEPHPDHPAPDPGLLTLRNTFRRTHRWGRVLRDADVMQHPADDCSVAASLFSTAPADMGLYGKPMARNAQVWTHDYHLLLDGQHADKQQLEQAAEHVRKGGLFGYRFLFPAMRVGTRELYWHRPLVACLDARTNAPVLVPCISRGYLTAYDCDRMNEEHPIELWPRLLQRPAHQAALDAFTAAGGLHETHRWIIQNTRNLLDAAQLWPAQTLPDGFARALLNVPAHETIADWMQQVARAASDAATGAAVTQALRERIAAAPRTEPANPPPCQLKSLTYQCTATRAFEVRYWQTIARLAHGKFRHKDNADCPSDGVSLAAYGGRRQRDLDALGDYLLAYYDRLTARARMADQTFVGSLPFHWRTDFDFSWSDGWRHNQDGRMEERNLVVMIPGRDRSRTVVMADHYDTAYMEDRYERERGGNGTRLAAAGADDNHSATASLMLGAQEFLRLSREGLLACDIWLVHLTGEEFPSDCMGARHLAQALVNDDLRLRGHGGIERRVSGVRVEGVYVLDMVAHNRDESDPSGRDVFQISPGAGREALRLAYHAHLANSIWNARVPEWNGRTDRRLCERGRRSTDPHGAVIPAPAQHPILHGEVRTIDDPRSSLYNTDGQIFSDVGIPVVLFMENYDINRHGYHDTADNMTNIDLDYGAALAAIAIETVSRAAATS